MSDGNGDTKIFSLLKKLLNVKEDRGSSEAEAAKAAETIQRILQDHNMTLAEIENQLGETDQPVNVKREKNDTGLIAMYKYQRTLMEAIANSQFCLHRIHEVARPRRNKALPPRVSHQHQLIGRTLNVQASIMLYDYLVGAVKRACKNDGYSADAREGHLFMEGAASRLRVRLEERRRERERESAAKVAAGNGTGKELVLADVYGSEQDQNNDFNNNFPPGTTAARRREHVAATAKRDAERKRLIAEGVDATVAFYRAYGYPEEQAIRYAADNKARDARAARRGGRGYSQRWTKSDQREYQKMNSPAYKAGAEAGKTISLDEQVAATKRKRIT